MSTSMSVRAFGSVLALGLFSLTGAAGAASAQSHSAQSKSCWTQADQQGLKGRERVAFHRTCMKGRSAHSALASPRPRSLAAKALLSPSGEDPAVRSKQCNDQGINKGLHDSALQAFRKSCMATAGPASAVGANGEPTKPTPDKPKLDALTDAPPH